MHLYFVSDAAFDIQTYIKDTCAIESKPRIKKECRQWEDMAMTPNELHAYQGRGIGT